MDEDFSAKDINRIRRKIRTDFIKDKNRMFPNEQEITAYLKEYEDYSDLAEDGLDLTIYCSFKIQYCKIFNLGLDENNNEKFKSDLQKTSKFTRFVQKIAKFSLFLGN